jgi:mannose-6-phosphate isomerase-like protein (cupin superfamily)
MTPDANAADAAEPIRDRVHRTSYTFRREGDNLWVGTWFEDGAHLPEHHHPTLTEYWEIIDGTAQVKLNGHTIELTPEDGPVLVAPNDRHELRNTSGRPLHARTKVIPAGRLQEFLTASGWAAREGLYNAQYADQHPRHGLASRLRANATATRRSRPRHHPRPNDSSCRSSRASPADPLTERPRRRPRATDRQRGRHPDSDQPTSARTVWTSSRPHGRALSHRSAGGLRCGVVHASRVPRWIRSRSSVGARVSSRRMASTASICCARACARFGDAAILRRRAMRRSAASVPSASAVSSRPISQLTVR